MNNKDHPDRAESPAVETESEETSTTRVKKLLERRVSGVADRRVKMRRPTPPIDGGCENPMPTISGRCRRSHVERRTGLPDRRVADGVEAHQPILGERIARYVDLVPLTSTWTCPRCQHQNEVAAYRFDENATCPVCTQVVKFGRSPAPDGKGVRERAERAARVIANTLTPTQFENYRTLLQFEAHGQQAFIPETCNEVRRIETVIADIVAAEYQDL